MKAMLLPVFLVILGQQADAETISYRLSTSGSLGSKILAEGTKAYSPETDIEIQPSGPKDAPSAWSKTVLARGRHHSLAQRRRHRARDAPCRKGGRRGGITTRCS
jgi:hypothetical protein